MKASKRIQRVNRINDTFLNRRHFIRLDKNERSYPFSASFLNSLKEKMDDMTLSMYPELNPLYEKIAEWLGIDRDELYLSSGSEYSIKAVFEALIDEGDTILLHKPGYAMFDVYADLYGAKKEMLEYDSNLEFDIKKYVESINNRHKMVVLENPNGFIGNSFSFKEVLSLVEKAHSAGAWAVIDEAYFHFCPVTVLEQIRKLENLIVIRTFSKAFGCAGLRLGYLASSKPVVELVKRTRPMHEITSFAYLAGLHSLENIGEMEAYVRTIERSRNLFVTRMKDIGIPVKDTCTNFVLVKWGNVMSEALKEKGILVRRPFTQSFLNGWTRVTLGNEEQMQILLDCVNKEIKGGRLECNT